MNNELHSILRSTGLTIDLTEKMIDQLDRFHKFLMNYNRKYNLTRIHKFEDVVIKHFADSIYPAQLFDLPHTVLDIGTGAGFPGVPIKIVKPDLRMVLVEGVQKKVDYLKELRDHLKLEKLDIIGRNADKTMYFYGDAVITRAVEKASQTIGDVQNCVKVGGYIVLLKTPGIDAEVKDAQKKWDGFFKVVMNRNYKLRGTPHERKLLVFQKTAPSKEQPLPKEDD